MKIGAQNAVGLLSLVFDGHFKGNAQRNEDGEYPAYR